ncbi:MAG: ABC transporter permease [Limisphaerales bacterium]
MNLPLIVIKSLRQHLLSTVVTALSIALAGGLLMSVWVVKTQSQRTFTQQNAGFDAVLGARGSKLQLVLNAVFHMESSTGNLKHQDYLDIKKMGPVKAAIPIAIGDNYHGSRIVGTHTNLFSDIEYQPGKKYEFAAGRSFDHGYAEAVVGSFVAQQHNLNVGDEFHPYHGLIFNEKDQHGETYVVTGVLKPSNTPSDRVIWIPIEGVQNMKGHDPKSASDVSAVLVQLHSPITGKMLDVMYNKQGDRLTFAWPIAQYVAELFGKIAWFDKVLALVAWLVALVATASVLASIYNSMNERRRDIAIMRALGARGSTIFSTIVLESAAIAALGAIGSFAVYAVIMSGAASIIRAQTGVVLNPAEFDTVMVWVPGALIGASALAGVVPAIKAYRTNVADNLTPVS